MGRQGVVVLGQFEESLPVHRVEGDVNLPIEPIEACLKEYMFEQGVHLSDVVRGQGGEVLRRPTERVVLQCVQVREMGERVVEQDVDVERLGVVLLDVAHRLLGAEQGVGRHLVLESDALGESLGEDQGARAVLGVLDEMDVLEKVVVAEHIVEEEGHLGLFRLMVAHEPLDEGTLEFDVFHGLFPFLVLLRYLHYTLSGADPHLKTTVRGELSGMGKNGMYVFLLKGQCDVRIKRTKQHEKRAGTNAPLFFHWIVKSLTVYCVSGMDKVPSESRPIFVLFVRCSVKS